MRLIVIDIYYLYYPIKYRHVIFIGEGVGKVARQGARERERRVTGSLQKRGMGLGD